MNLGLKKILRLRALSYLALVSLCFFGMLGGYPVRAEVTTARSGNHDKILSQLQAELAEKQLKYTDQHPDVIRLKNDIAALEQRKEKANSNNPKKSINPATINYLPEPRNADYFYESSLINLISSKKGSPTSIKIPVGIHVISKSLTIPRNISLVFERGAILQINPGVILTIAGTIEAGSYQIFSLAGTGKVLFGPGTVKEFLIRWWGAVGDGKTDDTKAVQAALEVLNNGLSCTLKGSAGDNYLVGSLNINNPPANIGPNQRFCGNGATLTQSGLGNVISVANKCGRLMIDKWNIIGSCAFVWVHDGLAHKPQNITFDGRPGREVSSVTAVNNENRWFYQEGKLYIFCACASQKNPNDIYHAPGIKVDGSLINNWSRFFSGTGIYLGSGTANTNISNIMIHYFDKAIYMHYALCNSVRDCELIYCNIAIFAEKNIGSNNINTFENLRIAAIYGEAAIYWKNSYGLEIRHCVFEVFLNRLFHITNCNAVKIDNIGMEVVSFGCKVHDVCLFDDVSGLSITNSALWAGGGGSRHALTSFFRFIHGCAGIRVAGNQVSFADSAQPASKLALYSTDGSATGLSFRNNSLRCPRWTTDSNPAAECDNNYFHQSCWVIMPISMVRQVISKSQYGTTLSFAKKPAPPSIFNNRNSASALDHQAGLIDRSSWKITWQGKDPQAILANVFSSPPVGTYTGVITLFYKADRAQTINLNLMSGGGYWDNIPVAGDGQWRCLSMIIPPIKFPQKPGPHGLMITTKAASGNLWLSHISLNWFANPAEAHALMGGLAPAPASVKAPK